MGSKEANRKECVDEKSWKERERVNHAYIDSYLLIRSKDIRIIFLQPTGK
jgi:hypothetical protein